MRRWWPLCSCGDAGTRGRGPAPGNPLLWGRSGAPHPFAEEGGVRARGTTGNEASWCQQWVGPSELRVAPALQVTRHFPWESWYRPPAHEHTFLVPQGKPFPLLNTLRPAPVGVISVAWLRRRRCPSFGKTSGCRINPSLFWAPAGKPAKCS